MANEKVFKIKIEGVEESRKASDSLLNVLKNIHDVIKDLNKDIPKTTTVTNNLTTAIGKKTQALDKEVGIQEKLNKQLSDQAQQLDNIITLEAQSAESIANMRTELSLLNEEWSNLDEGSEKFEELTQKIEELKEKLADVENINISFTANTEKSSEASKKMSTTFDKLSEVTDRVTGMAKGMISLFQSGIGIAQLFDEENEGLRNTMDKLSKVMTIIGTIQAFNNEILKKGTKESIANSAIEKVRIIQAKAHSKAIALSTKNTLAATVAQRAFNMVAKANPYLLLATGIAAVIGGLVGYSRYTDDATESTKKYKSALDGVVFSTKEARDAYDNHLQTIRNLALDYDVLTGKVNKYKAELLKIDYSYQDAQMKAERDYGEKRLEIIEEYNNKIKDANMSFDPFGGNLGNVVKLAEERNKKLTELQENFEADSLRRKEIHNQSTLMADAKKAQEAEKIQEQIFIDSLNNQDKEIAQLDANYRKQVEDAEALGINTTLLYENYERKKNEIQKKYSDEAVKKNEERNKKIQEQEKKNLDYIKQYDELLTESYSSEFDKRRTQVESNYKKRIDDLKEALKTEENLSVEAQEAINDTIKELKFQLKGELEKINNDQIKDEQNKKKKQLEDQKKLLDIQTTHIKNFYDDIKDIQKEVKDKNGVIDVEATKINLEEANVQLHQYVSLLNNSKENITSYYDDLLKLYDEDSIEYKTVLNEKEQALRNLEKQIKDTNKEIANNTEKSTGLQTDSWKDLLEDISKYAQKVAESIQPIFDAMSSIIQTQLDDANAKLEEITTKYDEVVEKREESDARIQELEEQAKNARGGRSIVLQSQIEREMEANKKLAAQEQDLAKQKEKQEKEAAKKEKQKKKLEITQSIVQGIVNTALGVTKAWSLGPIIGPIMAAIVGAAGAIQVATMTSQLSKLEDGGLLKGKRHSEGGMRVEGTNIEVEGGEYVVNRISTDRNLGLIKYINSQRKELTQDDINTYFTGKAKVFELPFNNMFENGGQMPVITSTSNVTREDLQTVVDSIQGINIQPVVSVVDINNAQSDMVRVNDSFGS